MVGVLHVEGGESGGLRGGLERGEGGKLPVEERGEFCLLAC